LQNIPFCQISVLALPAQWNAFEVLIPSGWNAKPIPLGSVSIFKPRNTRCIPACPVGPADRTGVVKIIAFLELEQKYLFFKGLG